jgi:UDP-2-acetamido-2,6-beta-L-arabino-hexul-4-ose reductase
MKIKIGITGSRGFIGQHLIETLQKNKNFELFYCNLPNCNLLNPSSLEEFVKNKDVIVHLAAVNRGTDTEIVAGTVVATYNLLSIMEKMHSRAKLIFVSSIWAETDTVYGQSKKLAEIMIKDYSTRNKTPATIFRLTNVFGERCKPFYNSVVATFCYQVANNQRLTIKNGNKKLNFIYVKDLTKLIEKEILTKRKRLFYFKRIVPPNELSVLELAKLIKSFKNLKNKTLLKSKFYRDLYRTYLSYTDKNFTN